MCYPAKISEEQTILVCVSKLPLMPIFIRYKLPSDKPDFVAAGYCNRMGSSFNNFMWSLSLYLPPQGRWWAVRNFGEITGTVAIEMQNYSYVQALDTGLFTLGTPHKGMEIYHPLRYYGNKTHIR